MYLAKFSVMSYEPYRPIEFRRLFVGGALAALAYAGCAGPGGSGALENTNGITPTANRARVPLPTSTAGQYIKHVVIVVQENRSFDNLFATFPGADGATSGKTLKGKTVQLKVQPLAGAQDINHNYATYQIEYNGGKMNGFSGVGIGGNNPAGLYPYQYVNPSDVAPYWTLAQQYGLADHMFSTQGSGSFTAHQDLIAGGTQIDANDSVIDYPLNDWSNWTCGAPSGTVTSLITANDTYEQGAGPFPCYSYKTLRDLLDAKSVSWKYYTPADVPNTTGALWNAFAVISAVYNGPEWTTNISSPETNVFSDITNDALPAVSWVIPDSNNSDHPFGPKQPDNGPSWVSQIVNAVGSSSYWNSTAVIIVWDDWGGFFDHVPPKQLAYGGLGMRVPMIVVSPYTPAGLISHTDYEFGSILKFVEQTFTLGSLGTSDVRAKSMANMFHFGSKARPFKKIAAPKSRQYLLHQRPSGLPVDTQ